MGEMERGGRWLQLPTGRGGAGVVVWVVVGCCSCSSLTSHLSLTLPHQCAPKLFPRDPKESFQSCTYTIATNTSKNAKRIHQLAGSTSRPSSYTSTPNLQFCAGDHKDSRGERSIELTSYCPAILPVLLARAIKRSPVFSVGATSA